MSANGEKSIVGERENSKHRKVFRAREKKGGSRLGLSACLAKQPDKTLSVKQ